MNNYRRVVFAPHDDGSGGFGVLCRIARALVRVADDSNYMLHLYFLNSSVAAQNGLGRVRSLIQGMHHKHRAFFVPTDNLIWLPKNEKAFTVDGSRIPDVLRKWVRPLWHCWPCAPAWIRPGLETTTREDWINSDPSKVMDTSRPRWHERILTGFADLRDLTPQWWQDVALGISMGVPQLHRVARREGFPSVEVGDWFFSVGLRGCMQESFVPPEMIAATEADLRMIEHDEFMAREVWLTLHQAPREAYRAHLASSGVRFREMTGLLWTGDPAPKDITKWRLAIGLRMDIDADLSRIRRGETGRVGYIVPGTTPVWKRLVEELRERSSARAAILDVDRGNGTVTLLERGGKRLARASKRLTRVPSEMMHLAASRACDFGITRTAGGVLGCAETQRPAVLVDEPGHWLGRIQRDQCLAAGLCVVVPFEEFCNDPSGTIDRQAQKLDTGGDLAKTVEAARKLTVGAEMDLAHYLFRTYIR